MPVINLIQYQYRPLHFEPHSHFKVTSTHSELLSEMKQYIYASLLILTAAIKLRIS